MGVGIIFFSYWSLRCIEGGTGCFIIPYQHPVYPIPMHSISTRNYEMGVRLESGKKPICIYNIHTDEDEKEGRGGGGSPGHDKKQQPVVNGDARCGLE